MITFDVISPTGIDFYPTKCKVVINHDSIMPDPNDANQTIPAVNLTIELIAYLPKGTITQLTTRDYPRQWKGIIKGLQPDGDGYVYDADLLSAALVSQGLQLVL